MPELSVFSDQATLKIREMWEQWNKEREERASLEDETGNLSPDIYVARVRDRSADSPTGTGTDVTYSVPSIPNLAWNDRVSWNNWSTPKILTYNQVTPAGIDCDIFRFIGNTSGGSPTENLIPVEFSVKVRTVSPNPYLDVDGFFLVYRDKYGEWWADPPHAPMVPIHLFPVNESRTKIEPGYTDSVLSTLGFGWTKYYRAYYFDGNQRGNTLGTSTGLNLCLLYMPWTSDDSTRVPLYKYQTIRPGSEQAIFDTGGQLTTCWGKLVSFVRHANLTNNNEYIPVYMISPGCLIWEGYFDATTMPPVSDGSADSGNTITVNLRDDASIQIAVDKDTLPIKEPSWANYYSGYYPEGGYCSIVPEIVNGSTVRWKFIRAEWKPLEPIRAAVTGTFYPNAGASPCGYAVDDAAAQIGGGNLTDTWWTAPTFETYGTGTSIEVYYPIGSKLLLRKRISNGYWDVVEGQFKIRDFKS